MPSAKSTSTPGQATNVRTHRVVTVWNYDRNAGILLPSPREGSPAIKVRRSGNEVAHFFPGDAIGPKDLPTKEAWNAQVAKGRIITEAEYQKRLGEKKGEEDVGG